MVDVPSPGDIVFFDWDGNGRYDHAGIVTWVESDHILTVEGNTSYKNQSNGGEVMSRVRQRALKMLFVHPRVLDV